MVGFLHSTVSPYIVAKGLVNKIQIQVIQTQVVQGTLDCRLRSFVAGILHPQLCGDKQFFTGNAAFLQSGTYRLLVHIGGGGVDQAITETDSVQNRLLTLCRVGNLKDTKTLQGHF